MARDIDRFYGKQSVRDHEAIVGSLVFKREREISLEGRVGARSKNQKSKFYDPSKEETLVQANFYNFIDEFSWKMENKEQESLKSYESFLKI